jgi:hypothetical protein
MLLPAHLLQIVVTYIPLPPLWSSRLDSINRWIEEDDPNDSIAYLLDIIDEVLEAGGFLSACDAAGIPAPKPHPTWCEWRRSIPFPRTGGRHHHDREDPTTPTRFDITSLSPPQPKSDEDAYQPSIRELRHHVGYLPLLNQYQFQTDIIPVLTGKPYLFRISDIASLCRRCCTPPVFLSTQNAIDGHGVAFNIRIAKDIWTLASEFYNWYDNRDVNIKCPSMWSFGSW